MRIDDLKDTLREHAELPHDAGLTGRADAVRGRVRTVRRRRAGVAVACLAGAVLAVPAINALDVTRPEPATNRSLAGRTAPETLVANGFTYEFDHGVEGDTGQPLRLNLGKADEPRLVSWTVNADRVEGRLVELGTDSPYDDTLVGGAASFETYEYVEPGGSADLRLTPQTEAPGQMAMAVYTLSDDRPAGVTGQGVTFRDEAADSTLLEAEIGAPGEPSVSFDITVPPRRVSLSTVCTAPESHWIHVTIEGQRGWSGTSCLGEAPLDPGGEGGFGFDLAGSPKQGGGRLQVGDTVRVTASIHPDDRGSSEPVSVPGAFVALGAYAEPDGVVVEGTDHEIDSLVEVDGHTWTLADLVTSGRGDTALDYKLGPEDRTTYVELGAANDGGELRWSTSLDGEQLGRSYSGRSGSFGPGVTVVLPPGESLRVVQEAVEGADVSLRFYVATYSLAD